MRHFRVYWLTCVLAMLAAAASATTIVLPTDKQLIAKSPLVVEGTVIASQPVTRGDAIWTEVTLQVERTLKGNAAGTIVIREIGGELDGRITKVWGSPEYTVGERVMAFLTPTPRGDYQTMDLFVGKFSEQQTLAGQRLLVRDDAGADVTLLDKNFQPVTEQSAQRDAARFEAYVASGGSGDANYGVDNAVLQRDVPPEIGAASFSNGGRLTPSSKFTLISDPSVFRWYAFDRGSSARWYSFGTQGGYSGGGINEIQTAMNAWNNYSEAKISYVYAGVGTGTSPGNTRSNGTNDVLFEDPNQEIAGSYSGSGVVGLGGFNGTAGNNNWTAPFAADAQHTAGNFRAVEITEGNFVIQDGVSAARGVSSSLLAEIAAHEFGHTLGFGHSTDGTALMYAYVTGRGPVLRTDDQLAARWLYPSGTGTTPPPVATVPAAPTSLNAIAGSGSISLTWSDNATNETGYHVWLSQNGGSYGLVSLLGANAASTTLNSLAAGTYRVYVTAYNTAGDSTASNAPSVTVTTAVIAGFSVNPSVGVANQTVFSFFDNSSGTITSRAWNFGDGTSSTAVAPTHVYTTAGTFNARLTVNGNVLSDIKQIVVSAATPSVSAPAPGFTWTPSNPTYDQTIQFYDQTSNSPTSWSWSFGDGGSATSQHPAHKYAGPGTYTVTLTAANAAGSRATTHSVAVGAPAPVLPAVSAAFDLQSSATAHETVSLTDRSTGSPNTWSWSFGDGGTSFSPNPTHAWTAPGTYTVTLSVGNGLTSSAASKTIVINPIAAYRALVSVSAQTNGIGGSVWRTELTIFNGSNEGASGQYTFLPSAGGAVLTRSLYVAPRQSITFNNALLDLFGLGSGAGAIAIEATGATATPSLKVTSRTFTTGVVGTYGQAVPSVDSDGLQPTLYLTGLEHDDAFRTNLGLVNRTNSPVGASLALYDDGGSLLATNTVVIPANNFQQAGLAAFFPVVGSGLPSRLSVRVNAGASSAVSAYASVVDNKTQDPVYIQAVPSAAGNLQVIPAVGRAPGANGTFWRSDVTIFNPNSATMFYTLRYVAAGTDGRNAAQRTIAVGPMSEVTYGDVAGTFGVTSGSGALEVRWTAGSGPVVTSRTYTPTANGGTFGQSIDPVASFRADSYVTGLRSDGSYRSNVGFVNGSDSAIGVQVTLLNSFGFAAGSTFVKLEPRSQSQYSVTTLFPNVNAESIGSFTLQAHTDDGNALFAYGSVVDNASGDPVFFAGQ